MFRPKLFQRQRHDKKITKLEDKIKLVFFLEYAQSVGITLARGYE